MRFAEIEQKSEPNFDQNIVDSSFDGMQFGEIPDRFGAYVPYEMAQEDVDGPGDLGQPFNTAVTNLENELENEEIESAK